jgi:hypothetical protein
MELQVGDRLTDETGDWEVVGRPYTTNGGKNAHVRVQRVSQPGVTETKMWGGHGEAARDRRGGQAMIRLGRRAALLVALYMLTSAATAYAECAWVLWEEGVARRGLRSGLSSSEPSRCGARFGGPDGSTRLVTAPSSCGAVLVRVVAFG